MSEIDNTPWTTTERVGVEWGIMLHQGIAPDWGTGFNPYRSAFNSRVFSDRETAEGVAAISPEMYVVVIEETYVTKILRLANSPEDVSQTP